MAIQALLWPIVSWLLREVVLKFVVLGAIFLLLTVMVPMAVSYLSPWLGTSSLSSAFSGLSSGVWFFLDLFNLGFGVPLLISALVTRFLIRRLPVIG